MSIIIHFVLIPLFIINIIIALLLDKLNEKSKIRTKYLTYIKLAVLFTLWLIYLLLTFLLARLPLLAMIYIIISVINFIISIFIISKQEKKHKFDKKDIYGSWKKCAKDLGVSFKIRRHGNLDLPVIYGYYYKHYLEIFPYNAKFKNNIFDPELKKVISVRVFKNKTKNIDKNVFSYERKFDSIYKNISYIENHIEPDWSKNNIPELLPEFNAEVKKIIDNSIKSFDKI